jgi:transposase
VAHRRWLARQQFQETASELVFADLTASVDGLTARKAAIAERLSRLAEDEAWWPTVARLRCFRGVDTLTAFALHLELGGDWQRFGRANALSAWSG